MTLEATTSRAQYGTNGTTGPFAVPFYFLDSTHLGVVYTTAAGVITTLTLTTNYTVIGVGVPAGGSITLVTPYAAGGTISIVRNVPKTQLTDYEPGDAFPAAAHEQALDKLTMIAQQIDEQGSRSLRVPEIGVLPELPGAADRAGKLLSFDSGGNPTVTAPSAGTATALALDLADTTTLTDGDAMIGWGAVTAIVAGVLTRYATLAAAVTGVGSNRADIFVRDSVAVAANTTIAATSQLRIENGAILTISGGITLTVNGQFIADPVTCFAGAGSVVFALGSTPHVLPEWWGAKGDANAGGTTGTNSTTALQAALNVPTIPVQIGYGNYRFSNLTMPNEKAMYGTGIHSSNLVCIPGSTGTMFTDQGSAAKITIKGVAFYGNNCSYTQGFYLGKTGAFGTEGLLDDLWVRDLPAGFAGIDVTGNVGHFGRILSQETGGLQILGSANMVDKIQSYGAKGFTVSATTVGTNLQLTSVNAMEIEAPASGVVALYLSGNSAIGSLSLAPTAATTYPNLVEIGASCTTWKIDDVNLVFAAGTAPTITNGNFKSGANYFGGNATGKSSGGEGNYSSIYAGQRPQCFSVVIANTAGTMQHAIRDAGGNVATNWASSVNAASSTLGNTPTGADGATAMATGAKIGSASTNTLWLDVPSQRDADSQFHATIVYNSSGTALTCTPAFISLNINGVTRTRLALQFYNATTGAAFALTTANIAAGKVVQVLFDGRLS
jgi:hypothetical protein